MRVAEFMKVLKQLPAEQEKILLLGSWVLPSDKEIRKILKGERDERD